MLKRVGTKPRKRRECQSSEQALAIFDTSLTCSRLHGYNAALVDRFCQMGFDIPSVVAAFEACGIDKMEGSDYQLEERYMGDITAKLFGEM